MLGPTIGETALVVKEDVVTNLPLVDYMRGRPGGQRGFISLLEQITPLMGFDSLPAYQNM